MIRKLSILILALIMSAGAIASSKRKIEDDDIGQEAKRVHSVELPYMYSDEQPRSKHVFTLDLSDKEWRQVQFERKKFDVYRTIEDILNEENFISLPNYSCPGSAIMNKIDGVFGNISGGILNDCVIIGMEYRPRSIRVNLKNVMVGPLIKAYRPLDKKWDIKPMENDPKLLMSEMCNGFSWKWVDCSIHKMNFWIDDFKDVNQPCSLFCEKLYDRIKDNGLESSIIRIAVSANEEKLYSFNVIYETIEQEEKGHDFLIRLKQNLIHKNFKIS